MVNLVGTLHFLEDRNDQTDRHELAQLVDEVKRCVVDTVPTPREQTTHSYRLVALRRARLVPGWVTVSAVQLLVRENLSHYITSHPGQLSLAIPLWVGIMSTSQREVMLCGWGVKAGVVREWVAGKSV